MQHIKRKNWFLGDYFGNLPLHYSPARIFCILVHFMCFVLKDIPFVNVFVIFFSFEKQLTNCKVYKRSICDMAGPFVQMEYRINYSYTCILYGWYTLFKCLLLFFWSECIPYWKSARVTELTFTLFSQFPMTYKSSNNDVHGSSEPNCDLKMKHLKILGLKVFKLKVLCVCTVENIIYFFGSHWRSPLQINYLHSHTHITYK